MESNDVVGLIAVISLFIGLPWLIMHYRTKWKAMGTITHDDEAMFEELYRLARRLNERMDTVERLVAKDDPHFRPGVAHGDHALGGQEPADPLVHQPASPTRFTSLAAHRSQP